VHLPQGSPPALVRGQMYWPLTRVPGFSLRLQPASQAAEITFAPEAFFATRLSNTLTLPTPSPVLPSAFLNYDVNVQSNRATGGATRNDVGALVEAGVSGGWGVVTSSHVGRDLTHSSASGSGWLRLETTYTRQMPDKALTLRAGDAATRSGLWGTTVYFGGIQIGTDYSLQPGFLTQPVPVFGGVSSAPSTVQLYVNDVLRKVTDVPAGPFAIDNLGALTGAGEARIVVRDVLGRETVIVQRYFTNAQLLAPGLADWSVEAGFLRENIGFASNDYGSAFASGTWRRGLTNDWTAELRGETTPAGTTVGLGAIAALPFDIAGRAAVSTSRYDTAGTGSRISVGLERQWSAASVYAQAQWSARGYREIGRPTISPQYEWVANSSFEMSRGMRVGLGISTVQPYDMEATRTATASVLVPLPKKASLILSASHAWGRTSGTFIGASFTMPLDASMSMQAAATARKGSVDTYVSVNQSSTGEQDFGWRVLAGQREGQGHAEGGAFYGGRYGRLYADISATPTQSALRAGASGGLVMADGHFFATKRVDQSFAIVEMPGFEGIGVGLGGNMLTRTDTSGVALIPNLSPHQANHVRLDAQDVPITAELESLEQQVVPSWRSGVKVDFKVRAGRAALLRIVLDDGEPAPAGAIVRLQGDKEEFFVARRGEAYVTGIEPASVFTLTWGAQSCRLQVSLPAAANDEIPRVGPVRCAGVKR
jgi:outer membrane usher protein